MKFNVEANVNQPDPQVSTGKYQNICWVKKTNCINTGIVKTTKDWSDNIKMIFNVRRKGWDED